MKLNLDRAIPRNKQGDPAFRFLDVDSLTEGELNTEGDTPCVLDVFSPAEVVELVNRALYQLYYQRDAHAKRQAHQTELLRPVKVAAKRVFNLPYSKLDQTQITDLMQRLKVDPSLGEEGDSTKS